MDPDVALVTALDIRADTHDRWEAATALLTWLYSGGFTPSGWTAVVADTDANRQLLITKMRKIREACRATFTTVANPITDRPT